MNETREGSYENHIAHKLEIKWTFIGPKRWIVKGEEGFN
jgi:hypothetical protein